MSDDDSSGRSVSPDVNLNLDLDDLRGGGDDDRLDGVVGLLAEYKLAVYVAVGALVLLVGSGRLGLPSLPPWLSAAITIFAVGIVPATVVGKKLVVERYMPDNRYNVAVIDPLDGYLLDAMKVPRGVWQNRDTGDYPPMTPKRGPVDYAVQSFEWDDDESVLRTEGVNPEISDPVDVTTRDGKLEQVFGELQESKRKYLRLQATLRTKELDIEERNLNALVAAVEHGVSIDPGTTAEIVTGDEFADLAPRSPSWRDDEVDEQTNGHDDSDDDVEELSIEDMQWSGGADA